MATPPPTPKDPGFPLPALLLLLSVTTGMVDAASVLGLDKVFSANMTGNIVFLGFGLARTPGFSVGPNLFALLTFLVGALAAGRLGQRFGQGPLRRLMMLAALLEAGLFWTAAAIAMAYDPHTLAPRWSLYAIIGLTAVAMGFRNARVRQLKVPDLTTTVLTLTITGIAADSTVAGGSNPHLRRRIAAVTTILLGAAAGALMVVHFGLAVPLFASGVIVLLGTAICVNLPGPRARTSA